jgi:YidC/Oxa1 family membrane protein insertase
MDLSQPERWTGLSHIIPENWFLIGEGIPVLAVVVFLTSYFQTKLTSTTTSSSDQTAAMTKMMSIYIPVLMAWLSYAYTAGLAVYFVASNVASLVQYAMMGRLDFSKLLGRRDSGSNKRKTK